MSNDAFKSFMAKVQEDAALQDELRAAGCKTGMSADALVAIAAKRGYAFKIEDVSDELSEGALEAAVGGLLPAVNIGAGGPPEPERPQFNITITNLGKFKV